MFHPMRLASLAVLALFVVACDNLSFMSARPGLPSSSPTASAGASPTATTDTVGEIEHPTGATDVVLRFEVSGGFVMLEFLATQAPTFTLYGDRTVIFRSTTQEALPAIGSVQPARPLRIARLSEDQVQAVLADALGPGGLALARSDYTNRQIMDLPTAYFTINAGGIRKRVAIAGLGIDIGPTPDAPALAAFAGLSTRLGDFDKGGAFPTDEYLPSRFRGSLLEGQPGAPGAKAWPWTTIAPAGFVTDPDPNGFPLAARVLTDAEVEALGISPYSGGFQGLTLIGPNDGKIYSLAVRPLLPDESK